MPQLRPTPTMTAAGAAELRKLPMKGRKATHEEAAYLHALEEHLTPAERSRLRALPWTQGSSLESYERSIAWRIEQVVKKGVHPRQMLHRLERHWRKLAQQDWLADFGV